QEPATKKAKNPGIAQRRRCLAITRASDARVRRQIYVNLRKKRNQSLAVLRRLRRLYRSLLSEVPIGLCYCPLTRPAGLRRVLAKHARNHFAFQCLALSRHRLQCGTGNLVRTYGFASVP